MPGGLRVPVMRTGAVTAKADGHKITTCMAHGSRIGNRSLRLINRFCALCISFLVHTESVVPRDTMSRGTTDSTAEEEPLLPTQNGQTVGRQKGKLSSFLSLFSKQSPPLRGENGLEEGEDEYERAASRQGPRSAGQWRTLTLYVVLLGLGGLLGWFFTSRWDATHHHNEGKDGPMVPPVWTLPPVRSA